jgi:hypothetical protein
MIMEHKRICIKKRDYPVTRENCISNEKGKMHDQAAVSSSE